MEFQDIEVDEILYHNKLRALPTVAKVYLF